MRSRSNGLAALLTAAVVSSGCGDEERGPTLDPLPSASICNDSWRQMFHGLQERAAYAGPLSFANDLVVYSTNSGIHTLSTPPAEAFYMPSGRVNSVTEDSAWNLWTEGENQIIYSRQNQLWGVPIAGGTPALILDGGPGGSSFAQALDASYFYWVDDGYPGPSLWRMPRAGGDREKVADLPEYAFDLVLSPGAVIVSQHYVVPLDGTPARELDIFDDLGADATGVYGVRSVLDAAGNFVNVETWCTRGSPPCLLTHATEIVRAPVDGGALEPFWKTKPPSRVYPHHVWSDGSDGWLVASLDLFDDGTHEAIGLLDADENSRLVACDPSGHDNPSVTGPGWVFERPAFSPDAAYVAVSYQDADVWTIVEVPR